MLSDIRKMMSRLELLQRHLACSLQAGHKPVANGLKQCSKLHGRCPLAFMPAPFPFWCQASLHRMPVEKRRQRCMWFLHVKVWRSTECIRTQTASPTLRSLRPCKSKIITQVPRLDWNVGMSEKTWGTEGRVCTSCALGRSSCSHGRRGDRIGLCNSVFAIP